MNSRLVRGKGGPFYVKHQDALLIRFRFSVVLFDASEISMYRTTMRAFGILPMVPLEILPMVPFVANVTIGNQRTLNVSRQPMVPLVPMLPLVETLVPIW